MGRSGRAVGRFGAVVVTAATVAGVSGFASGASAEAPHTGTSAKPTAVVKEVTRGSFGEILVTKKGSRALYIDTQPPCTGACLGAWPPLLMPTGKTIPAGAPGLGTTAFGSGQLQVTDDGMPLYTFSSDTKKSVDGNAVAGFFVVRVSSSA